MKDLHWIGSTLEDLKRESEDLRREVGFALHLAQAGLRATNAVVLLGFGGAHMLEIVADGDGVTHRAIYTVRFERAVYVLHFFQKKSVKGIATPKREIQLIRRRLKIAERHYREDYQDIGQELVNVRAQQPRRGD